MLEKDPIAEMEKLVREMHDVLGRRTQPVLNRYPLTFLFLLTFGFAALLHGFEIFIDQVVLFHEHPITLLLLGTAILLVTGSLYKTLGKN